jgi:hypothetical protein
VRRVVGRSSYTGRDIETAAGPRDTIEVQPTPMQDSQPDEEPDEPAQLSTRQRPGVRWDAENNRWLLAEPAADVTRRAPEDRTPGDTTSAHKADGFRLGGMVLVDRTRAKEGGIGVVTQVLRQARRYTVKYVTGGRERGVRETAITSWDPEAEATRLNTAPDPTQR